MTDAAPHPEGGAGAVTGQEVDPHTGRLLAPRTVQAREPSTDPPRPVIAVSFDELSGEPIAARGTREEHDLEAGADAVVRRLRDAGMPWVVVTDEPAKLWRLLEEHAGTAAYRARGTIREHRPMLRDGRMASRNLVSALFHGFRWGKMTERMVLDPAGFTDQAVGTLLGLSPRKRHDAITRATALWSWGADVVAWCQEVGLRMRPGRGGIAAQLLTDARFWPAARRKVPRLVNNLARPHLPGNHYQLRDGAAGRYARATEVDLSSAHHDAASRISFTDADDLYARGSWREEPREGVGFYPGSDAYDQLRRGHGLLRLELEAGSLAPAVQEMGRHPLMPPPGERRVVYAWTEELDGLEADGARVLRILGGLISRTSSSALNLYAGFALEERRRAPAARARWLKPLLLSVYGTMAQGARPPATFSWHPTPKGTREVAVLAGEPVDVFVTRPEHEQEPRYVNVCDRGLIEAHVRDSVLAMARALQGAQEAMVESEGTEDAQLLAIRADSVILGGTASDQLLAMVDAYAAVGRPVRGLWRRDALTNLELESATHYRSDQRDRLPGLPRSARSGKEDRADADGPEDPPKGATGPLSEAGPGADGVPAPVGRPGHPGAHHAGAPGPPSPDQGAPPMTAAAPCGACRGRGGECPACEGTGVTLQMDLTSDSDQLYLAWPSDEVR